MPTDPRPWPRLMRAGLLKGQTFPDQRSYNEALAAAKKKAEAAARRREQRAASDKLAARVAARGKASAEKRSRQRSK